MKKAERSPDEAAGRLGGAASLSGRFVWLASTGVVLSACGGTAGTEFARTTGEGTNLAAEDDAGLGGAPAMAEDTSEEIVLPATSAPEEDVEVFDDPGCPEQQPALEIKECDPFAQPPGCDPGLGCVPFVDYPDFACSPEVYGARCAPVGVGTQGDACSTAACAEGFLCVATGRGTQCAQLCPLPGSNTCPPGLVCGNVDIEGYGTCF